VCYIGLSTAVQSCSAHVTWLVEEVTATVHGACRDKVMRRVLGSKRERVMRGWIRCHQRKLDSLHNSPNVIGLVE